MSNRRKVKASAPCGDCGTFTNWSDRPGEYYMVHDEVWAAAGMDPDHVPCDHGGDHYYLCIGCLEARLGRELTAADFTDAPLNGWSSKTPRLQDRISRIHSSEA